MNWWYERNGQRAGPVTEGDLISQVAQGHLSQSTLVWREGLPQWISFKDVDALAALLPPEPPPLPPPLPPIATPPPTAPLEAIAVSAKPASIDDSDAPSSKSTRPPVIGTAQGATVTPATWYRFFARQIDTCFLALPAVFLAFMGIGLVASPTFVLSLQDPSVATFAALALMCVVGPLVEAGVGSLFGNTPGKALFGLKSNLFLAAP